MRLTLSIFGFELDITLGHAAVEAETCSLDGGITSSSPIGFAPSPGAQWERPLNFWDEPGEGFEDT